MGEVYLGTMVSHAGRRPVAIKRVATERLLDAAAVGRLVAEARLGFQLTHANVCQVLDLVFDRDHAYFVMEYVRGLDLRALISRLHDGGQWLDPASALYIAREVARALDYAHRLTGPQGEPLHVIHGDVTPPNILLSDEGEVKLADFGIARALGTAAPGTDVIAGTRGFVAPEIVGGAIDHRIDIYALGATLHAALSGEPPPAPGTAALADRGDVPTDVAQVIERAIARDAGDRYLSAAELETALAFELARRYPGYTPAALAETVRAAARAEAALPPSDQPLFAIETQASTFALGQATDVVPPWQRSEPELNEPEPRRMTETISDARAVRRAPRRAGWAPLAIAAIVAGIIAVSVVAMTRRSPGGAVAGSAQPPADAKSDPPRADAAVRAIAAADAAAPAAPADAGAAEEVVGEPRTVRQRARRPRETRPAFLSVNATPWGAVEVDGRRVAPETPAYRLEVAPGRRRVRVIFADGRRSRPRTITLAPGEHRSIGFKQ
jgi:serine/threonine protein kinase